MKLAYVAKDSSGKTVKGELEAVDKKEAVNMLREKELLVLELNESVQKISMFSSLYAKS